jgi:predicted O-methyltransferase YrrM
MNDIILPVQKEYLESFRLKNDSLISEMEEYAKTNNVPILNWDSAELLEIMINLSSPKRVLEIGTAIAYSSIRIARNMKKKGVVHTIEKSENNIKVAKTFIEKAGLQDKINIIQGDALNVMLQLEKKYDFIFLDADKQDYKTLFDYCLILLKKGGIIFVDNLLWKGFTANKRVPVDYKTSTKQIREFNNVFMTQKSLKTTILPVGDGIGLGVKF